MPDHWQTLLAVKMPGSRTVPPLEQDKLNCRARIEALNREVEAIEGPVILVAHSAGVLIVAHWAQHYDRQIKGAVLATPADIERPLPNGYPRFDDLRNNGWLPLPRKPLPFRSILVASANDPLARLPRVEEMAHDWKSDLVNAGEVGHLNPAAGYGPWPLAKVYIDALEHDVKV
jgi:predicted alpha/beta hydrolase family esterase